MMSPVKVSVIESKSENDVSSDFELYVTDEFDTQEVHQLRIIKTEMIDIKKRLNTFKLYIDNL